MTLEDERRRATVRRVVSRLEEVIIEGPEALTELGTPVTNAKAVERVIRPLLEREAVEVVLTLLLDGRHRLFGVAESSRGTLNHSLVHPREVFGPAIRLSAAAIIVAHNHPSGDGSHSAEDVEVTRRLRIAGELLGVPLLDHVIIGARGSFTSLRASMEF